ISEVTIEVGPHSCARGIVFDHDDVRSRAVSESKNIRVTRGIGDDPMAPARIAAVSCNPLLRAVDVILNCGDASGRSSRFPRDVDETVGANTDIPASGVW